MRLNICLSVVHWIRFFAILLFVSSFRSFPYDGMKQIFRYGVADVPISMFLFAHNGFGRVFFTSCFHLHPLVLVVEPTNYVLLFFFNVFPRFFPKARTNFPTLKYYRVEHIHRVQWLNLWKNTVCCVYEFVVRRIFLSAFHTSARLVLFAVAPRTLAQTGVTFSVNNFLGSSRPSFHSDTHIQQPGK